MILSLHRASPSDSSSSVHHFTRIEKEEYAYQVTTRRLLSENRLVAVLAEAQRRLYEGERWRRRSVGEVSEACHNKHIRQELSVPSAESSYGIREGFEREESYQLNEVCNTRDVSGSYKRY